MFLVFGQEQEAIPLKQSRMRRVCSEISIINTIFPRRCFKMTTPSAGEMAGMMKQEEEPGAWSMEEESSEWWHWQLARSRVEFSLV